MTFTVWVYIICAVLTCVGIVLIIRSNFEMTRGRNQRGATPSQNATVVTSNYAGANSDQSSSITVPRDPQEYAKAMAPKK